MNPDDIFQTIQKSFRVTLGATNEVIESFKDSQRREDNLAKLQSNPNQMVEELAAKGEVTEQEARAFVDSLMAQMGDRPTANPMNQPISNQPSAPPELQADLQELITQIAAMRSELEHRRQLGDQ
ncbi:MAG: hypothetical protein KME20_14260 [Kaiparowitsia implicata GSE-PSE-MK54-09C]|jgi:polyhydroxyalkanoate synthesis regulator phasin|nr:hypothetical protein [Kaiparowitsia implicata GSE-PSE-MK54-09C]